MLPAPMASTFHILSFGSTCPGCGTGCCVIRQHPHRSRAPQTSPPQRRIPHPRWQAIRSETSASSGRENSPPDSNMIPSQFKSSSSTRRTPWQQQKTESRGPIRLILSSREKEVSEKVLFPPFSASTSMPGKPLYIALIPIRSTQPSPSTRLLVPNTSTFYVVVQSTISDSTS